ncbi:10094_t:CDS:2 [Entrophospora sp. SA101]|nr:10094_t:CDS:2 [Entrophospora sp. SA101]
MPTLEECQTNSTAVVDITSSLKIISHSNLVKYVDTIEECPPLSPRDVENLTIHDLRADDITYIMALGDSITAAFAAKGQRNWGKNEEGESLTRSTNKKHKKQIKKEKQQQQKIFLNNNNGDYNESLQTFDHRDLYENRGLSFAIGGDENATTLARFLNYYSRDGLIGASLGDHFAHICLFCLPYQYRPSQDRLNGAQSGAMADNLRRQVNYLLLQLNLEKARKGSRHVDGKFKFLNLFIGNNDLCQSCNNKNTSPEKFEKNIRDTLDNIMNKIPNTIVNIMGVSNVSQVYDVTRGQKYCKWYDVPYINFECTCAFSPGEIGARNRKIMDDLAVKYNKILQNVVADYSKIKRNDFAIVQNRFVFNLTTFPIDGLISFLLALNLLKIILMIFTSEKTHIYLSKVLWNSLVAPFKKHEPVISWDGDMKIRCFGEDDRIITY